jgi:hypothetical protein
VHGIVAHFLRDRDELDVVLRQLPDIELKLEVIAEEPAARMDDDDIEGRGLDVPASIMRWNSGRRSLVADAPGSTKVSIS